MHQVVTAIYEDGILRPESEINLPPQTRVRITVETLAEDTPMTAEPWETWERVCEENPVDSGGERLSRDRLHERD
jgi:predicted DNA-binding antitoxin AbrB/MazE fold protein